MPINIIIIIILILIILILIILYHHHIQGDERSEEQSSEGSASLIDLLRRIPIICLEDSLLHPSYPIIIWLMISCSHGYIPHRCLLDICVLFMHDISICNYRDSSVASLYVHSGKTCRSSSSIYDKHFIETSQAKHWMDISNPTIRTLLVSIAMRGQLIHPMNHIYWSSISKYLSDETSILVAGSYGGMTGDMQMIDEFTMLWIKRLVVMPMLLMESCVDIIVPSSDIDP